MYNKNNSGGDGKGWEGMGYNPKNKKGMREIIKNVGDMGIDGM
jgi:hypothetical protein